MFSRRAVIGLSMLCALAFSAVVVQGAAAAKGTVTYTCKKKAVEGGAGYSKAHCKREDVVATGAVYEDIKITEETIFGTSNAGTTESSPVVLKSAISGIEAEIRCTTLQGTGTGTNTEVGTELVATGTDTMTLSGCTAPKPAGQGCVVKGGGFESNPLRETTAGQPAPEEESNTGMFAKVEPVEKEAPLATVTLEKCKTGALNTAYPLTGSFRLKPNGTTTDSTHPESTGEGTLKFMGQKAGLEVSVTMVGHKSGESQYIPITMTTN